MTEDAAALKATMLKRAAESEAAQKVLNAALEEAFDAEIAYLQAAHAIMIANGDPQKLAKEYWKRFHFLQEERSRSTASRLLNASRNRRWLRFLI